MEKYSKTKSMILAFSLLLSYECLGQVSSGSSNTTVKSNPPLDERESFRPSSGLYDEEAGRLKTANDTLNIYVENQKKVSIVSLNLKAYEGFEGFEKDIPVFLDLIDQMNLNLVEKSYKIRFNPVSKEVSVEENSKIRFKAFQEGVLPVLRHEVTFSYRKQLMEVSMFLGEWDELMVLRDANFSAVIQKEAEENEWFGKYKNAIFNKDIRVDEKGLVKVITYTEAEKSNSLSLGFDVGIKYFAGEFLFNQQVSLFYKPRQIIKSNSLVYGFMLSLDWNQSFSRNQENKYRVSEARFVNVGPALGKDDKSFRFYYGRMISSSGQGLFDFNRNKFGFDLLVNSDLRVVYEFYFGSKGSDSINSIGISFPIVSSFNK